MALRAFVRGIGVSQLAFGLLVPVMTGCYSTPESFVRRASKLDCVRLRHCDQATYDEMFDDMGDCRDKLQDVANDAVDQLEDMGCEYQADEGRDCIHEGYETRKDCSDSAREGVGRACANVFQCGTGLERGDDETPASIVDAMLATMPPDDDE